MPRRKTHNIESSCVSFDDACYDETPTKKCCGSCKGDNHMAKKKKEETVQDILDHIEEDLQKLREKLDDEDMEEDELDDEDNDDEEDE